MAGESRAPFAQAGRILVLSLSCIPRDGRILRQIGTLRRAGKAIEAIGAEDAEQISAGFPYHAFSLPDWHPRHRLQAALAFLSARALPGVRLALALAGAYPGVEALRKAALSWAEQQPDLENCAVIAHDWTSLPAAIALKQRFGLPFHYDSHEFATQEHAHNLPWRMIFPPLIGRIEAAGMALASSASCPGEGIRDAMNAAYRPDRPVTIVANAPEGTALIPRETGETVELLYHGLFKPDRGLLELVASAAQWPARYRLVLRGHAPNAAFGRVLDAAIARSSGRVRAMPMVPVDAVTREARKSDIGVFLPDMRSPQNRFAAPNKLFEYLQAGLMVIVPRNSEMGELIAHSGAGVAIEDASKLPALLETLDAAMIDAYRARAHALAKTSNWANEERHFLEALGIERI